jgi:2,3-bisphosphoglycerate-dependent phosphoglycerate mutase
MAWLVIVRHGQTEWNAKGWWTGKTEVDLTEQGREEAREAGAILSDYKFDVVYLSGMRRAEQTYTEMCGPMNCDIKAVRSSALDERDYGTYTGKNKWEIKEQVGEEKFQDIRRGWDTDIPGGESLQQVYERVIPYYENNILPELKEGKNILIVAHGNSMRALVKYVEKLSPEDIENIELGTGQVRCYNLNEQGEVKEMKILSTGQKA